MSDTDYALKYSQIGLPDLSRFMIFATIHLKPEKKALDTYEILKSLARDLKTKSRGNGHRHWVVSAVDTGLWSKWCELTGVPEPLASNEEVLKAIDATLRTSPPYYRDGGDLYFHVKSDSDSGRHELYDVIRKAFEPLAERLEVTYGNPVREGHVYGRRLLHGLIRSVDPINLSARAVVGDEDPACKGSCYCLTQRFMHDWEAIGPMPAIEIENMIGRDHEGNLVPNKDERSHLKRARVMDHRGLNYRILTQGQPFGDSPTGHGREEGVYVSAYAKSVEAFNEVLASMVGNKPGTIYDEHFTVSASDQGNIWYVPSSEQLGLREGHGVLAVPINPFFEERSDNGLMYYNSKDFLHNWGRQPAAGDQPLSPRIMELLGNTFSRWHNNWYRHLEYPDLGHLRDCIAEADKDAALRLLTIPERKGLTIKMMLRQQLTGDREAEAEVFHVHPLEDPKRTITLTLRPEQVAEPGDERPGDRGRQAEIFRIEPREILAGVVPPFTLGTGIRIMTYLAEGEHLDSFFLALDENSMAGHIVPDYETLTRKGVGGLLRKVREGLEGAEDKDQRRFLQSAIYALEGVQGYFRNFATLAREERDRLAESQKPERDNLSAIAERMDRLASEPPASFHDAAQLVFGMHCCLHLVGELVSLGRLDQVLAPFYERDSITGEEAQEIIDAFWIKMDEQVLMNRQYFDDWRTYGTCAVPYFGGAAVPQGDKASQWVMQATLGGYLANDDGEPRDGCNAVTRMCLRATRRLPLNSPCVSLRVNPDTPEDVVGEAAQAILSGGAEPALFQDDLLSRSMAEFGAALPLRDARDFCADGCWEPIIPGKTEFGLTYTAVMPAVEATLNQGATYANAGPTYLRGSNVSFPSPPVEEIESFDQFLDFFYRHYKWLAAETMNNFLTHYGNLWRVCPSPLLSTMIDGCLEAKRDLTHGGARYHFLAPMIFGMPCAIDSLWAIDKLVFDPATAVTSLPELRECLLCDWGYDMIETLQNATAGPERAELRAMRFKQLRETALALPRFGSGHAEIDAFGGKVASRLGEIFMDTLERPAEAVSPDFAERLRQLEDRYSLPGRPRFAFKLTPAYGTFEDYYGLGLGTGASADGRRKGATLSSNFSPMPSPSDRSPEPRPRDIFTALRGWNGGTFDLARNIPGPIDIDIREDFPKDVLIDVIRAFGRGELGFNILTVSCSNVETLKRAIEYPERYDLLRLRMGGWSEFFVSMFPAHQQQHLRRPLFVAGDAE